jgi:hypothetical protein
MVKLTRSMENLGAPLRVPGQYYTVSTKWGVQLRKWPKKRGAQSTAAQTYKEAEFGGVARDASNPEPGMLQSATLFAKGTMMVPRDFIIGALMGTLIDVTFDDGTPWPSYRSMTVNAQLVMDQLNDEPGSLAYRDSIGWGAIMPGLNGFVLTSWNNAWTVQPPTIGGGGIISYAVYDTPGAYTYNIPAAAQYLAIYMTGGGGGGGGGARRASGTQTSGGAAGGGAALIQFQLRTLGLPASLSLTVASGGAGGAARTTDNNNGNPGNNGGTSSIVASADTYQAGGGNGGAGGNTVTSVGGAGSALGTNPGSAGASGGVGSAGSAPGGATGYGPTGGGSGAGVPTVPADRNGGNGGAYASASGLPTNGAAGGIASSSTAPGAGIFRTITQALGGGGAGGYFKNGTGAVAGANGAKAGGGGGGGASSLNGQTSGKGGDGGAGSIIIVAI